MAADPALEAALARLQAALGATRDQLAGLALIAPEGLEEALAGVDALLARASGSAPDVRGELAEAASRARAAGTPEVAASLDAWLARLQVEAGEVPQGVTTGLRAVGGLDALGRPWAALALADAVVRALRRSGHVPQALAFGDEVLTLPWPLTSLERALMLRATLGETALVGGDPARGREELDRVDVRAELNGLWRPRFHTAMARAAAAHARGEHAVAEVLAEQARPLAVTHRDPNRYLAAVQLAAHAAEARGDRAAAYGKAVVAIKSLRVLLGTRADALGREWLDGMRARWGDAAYDAAAIGFLASTRGAEA